jgi:hypothetical protein
MNPATEDIKDLLVAQSLGTFQVDLFIGELPSSPDASIAVIPGTGQNPGLWYEWERPGIQIMVRAAAGGYTSANTSIDNIKNYLHGLRTTINSTRYALINQQGDILYLGKDESNRPVFSANFRIQRTTA